MHIGSKTKYLGVIPYFFFISDFLYLIPKSCQFYLH